MNVLIPAGGVALIAVDRESIAHFREAARPWIVKTREKEYRCRAFDADDVTTRFDLDQKPCVWLETRNTVSLLDAVEIKPEG